jgi:Flp pilus assembly protein TadG
MSTMGTENRHRHPGRPTLPATERRDRRIVVFLRADEEKSAIAQAGSRRKVGNWLRKIAFPEKGQAILEFALLLPIALLLLIVVSVGGQLVLTSINLAQAARAGAIAAQQAEVSGGNQLAAAEAAEHTDMGSGFSTVVTSVSDSTTATGQVLVTVTLHDSVKPLIGVAALNVQVEAET